MKQYTIYDEGIETDRRPCRYRFHRYIGQKVRHIKDPNDVYEIVDIGSSYYTTIRSKKEKGLLVGTPTTIYPVDRREYVSE